MAIIEFPSRLCPFTKEPFHHHKKINLDLTVNALGAVNELDPVEAWKIRTYITTYHPVPIELQQEVPMSHATILKINGEKCDIMNKKCDRTDALYNLKKIENIEIGYYNTRDIWYIKQDDDLTTLMIMVITICCAVGLIIIGLIFYHCCCYKKKTKKKFYMKNTTRRQHITSSTANSNSYVVRVQ